jgi:hypothetical protein
MMRFEWIGKEVIVAVIKGASQHFQRRTLENQKRPPSEQVSKLRFPTPGTDMITIQS